MTASASPTRLSDFIRANANKIIGEWEVFAKTLTPAADDMTRLALRDHIQEILTFIANDLESPQTPREQIKKSHGDGPKEGGLQNSAAETHAALRLTDGFDIDQMVSEYRALRASVVKLWGVGTVQFNSEDLEDLTRFNEAVDQAMTESIRHYTKKLDHSKDIFLGILGHDLRNPLGAIMGSAQLTLKIGSLNERQVMLQSQISESASRIDEIINHVLDLIRTRFGSGLPVAISSMDFGVMSQQIVREMRAAYPGREIALEISGNTEGKWDAARIEQVFSNLISNALQYGLKDKPVGVSVKGSPEDILLSVHNDGTPIPPEKVARIFDALTRAFEGSEHPAQSANLGLGLYITKEIIVAHGGTIEVTSSDKDGTTFLARFPRVREF